MGIAPALVIVVVAASTSACTFVFQLPIHRAVGCAATLSICRASAGRVTRQPSAVLRAFEYGSTHSVAPASRLGASGLTVGGGGAGTGASLTLRRARSASEEAPVSESPEQAATDAATRRRARRRVDGAGRERAGRMDRAERDMVGAGAGTTTWADGAKWCRSFAALRTRLGRQGGGERNPGKDARKHPA